MIWIQLTAGRGPGECQLAIAPLVDILRKEANAAGIDANLLAEEVGPHGLLSALVSLEAPRSSEEALVPLAASWTGTIQWTCASPLRPGWKRKNWFVSASVLRPPETGQEMKESDLRIEACRASGPGGQHVNKTNSAVRVTHVPTGLVAHAQEDRSQQRNRALAVARLAAALVEREQAAGKAAEKDKWRKHDEVERGNPVRTYAGLDFKRQGGTK